MSLAAAKSPAIAVVWLGGTAPLALEPAAGRPIAGWVLELARELGCPRLATFAPATASARVDEAGLEGERLDREALLAVLESGEDVLLLRGDAPLLSAEVLTPLLSARRPGRLYQPGGLVVAVRLQGAGLDRQGEEDLPLEAVSVDAESFYVPGEQAEDALLVRHRRDHASAQRRLWRRLAEGWLDRDVAIDDPHRVTIDASVRLAPGAVVHADVSLLGKTTVGPGCELHAGSWLRDARLGSDVEVLPYSVLDGASLGDGCRVGPFARLRPGTELGEGARIGNFVEVKNATLGAGAKANHLAYVGDAEVGAGTNIGAGVVTCNYDGLRKHRTTIGKDAFVGTDTILVAPVEVGDGAFVAAGSVIVRDVPGDALGIARSRQRNIAGWASTRGPRARRDDESS